MTANEPKNKGKMQSVDHCVKINPTQVLKARTPSQALVAGYSKEQPITEENLEQSVNFSFVYE